MIGIDSKHYPETLGRMFFINAPLIFSAAWVLFTPFLDERTLRKVEIISSESAWKKRLRECIDPAQLPVEYGGELHTQVFPGSRSRRTALASGKSFHQATEVLPKGATVRFKWFCRPGDIGFSLHFVAGPRAAAADSGSAPPPPGSAVLYSAPTHAQSDKALVEVTGQAAAEGYFVGTWNNTQGWWSREVFHRYDQLVEGRPLAVGGLTGVTAAVMEGKAVDVVSEVPASEGESMVGGGGDSS